jgi:hypothetical protein
METHWTAEQVIALAPDTQVAKAARGLARPGKWRKLGRDDQACWGEYQGSGKTPYRTAIGFDGPAFKCSCPSRKRPCKHGIGLLLLSQAEPRALEEAEPPEWVGEWLVGRAAQAIKKARQQSEAVADPKAQARRVARRLKRVRQGVEVLSLWTEDLVHRGLGSLQSESPSFWEAQAARLVDAQAPGLARQVREMGTIPASGDGWIDRLLGHLARLYLLLEAFRRLDDLPTDLQEEVRSQVGWTQDQDALSQQNGDRDHWLVVGRREAEEDRLRVQHTWLWGMDSKKGALVLNFAPLGRPFESGLIPGADLDAELVFWPSSFPLRALVKVRHATGPIKALPGHPDLDSALIAFGAALARNPWLQHFLMVLEDIVPLRRGNGWAVRDRLDHLLPLTILVEDGWRLLALSGGHPITLVAEWDGEYLNPLSVWMGGELILIGGVA